MAEDAGNKTWGGRFESGPSSLLKKYSDSQHYDRRLYAEDIEASKAHAAMLAETGVLARDQAERIISGLERIQNEIETGAFVWKPELEDVHMNIEARLVELIGPDGKRLHTARSRNDQIGLDFRMHAAKSCAAWRKACLDLCAVLRRLAADHADAIMPGLTHMQPAQPVSLAHYLLAYAGMFKRDVQRINDALVRMRVSPLGAGALAGTTYPVDPLMTARAVGFNGVYANSMDAVSDRDFVLEALFAASVIMAHLSRLCEELIFFANPSFGYITLPDAFSTGSSIMPQKKNPDPLELMRGKTGRVYGALMAMLTIMKGLPLTYNRDLQEDKEGFFDSSETVLSSLEIMAAMLPEISFNAGAMLAACERGCLNATELADYLAGKGMPFRDAHRLTGRIVAWAEKAGLKLEEIPLERFKEFDASIDAGVFQALDLANAVKRRESLGGTGPLSVQRQLKELGEWLDKETERP